MSGSRISVCRLQKVGSRKHGSARSSPQVRWRRVRPKYPGRSTVDGTLPLPGTQTIRYRCLAAAGRKSLAAAGRTQAPYPPRHDLPRHRNATALVRACKQPFIIPTARKRGITQMRSESNGDVLVL